MVFVGALIPRALYNCVWMEHRICHFGDAYNFLRSGSALLKAVAESKSPSDVLNIFFHPAPPTGELLQAMTSMNLTERLLIDGPVFPAWLAFIEWVSGVNPTNPVFDTVSVKLCLCNSILDALCCVGIYVCGRLAFNKRIALLGATLFALYPAAIINTQHCYSEPFSYAALTAWLALVLTLSLRHGVRYWQRVLAFAALGVTTAVLMLSKPAFVLLPPIVAAVIFALRLPTLLKRPASLFSNTRRVVLYVVALFAGFLITVSPWLFFNKAITGQWSLFVNRVPAFNIFHGNQLKTDGWRCYPYRGEFPGESKQVITSVLNDAAKAPVAFAGLELKKIARLWSGVWNEYHYSLFGVPIEVQSLLHQLILFLSVIAAPLFLRNRHNVSLSREVSAGLVLLSVGLFHFAYLPFEAISRYAITAMPAAVLLAAYTIVRVAQQNKRAVFGLTLSASLSFVCLSLQGELAVRLASLLPERFVEFSPYLAWMSCALPLLMTTRMVIGLIAPTPLKFFSLPVLVPTLASALTLLVAFAYSVQSNDWREWSAVVQPKTKLKRRFAVPPNSLSCVETAFVLVDLQSDVLSPQLNVSVNGHVLKDEPFPLARLMMNNRDILQCLAIQGEGMGRDFRGFRHWWVVPVKPDVLHSGAENVIELAPTNEHDTLKIFGDRISAGTGAETQRLLPSLYSYSYTKGFTTFDHRDARVFEPVQILSKVESSYVDKQGYEEAADLSSAPGTQHGALRMYLLVPSQVTRPEVSDSGAKADTKRSAVSASPRGTQLTGVAFAVSAAEVPSLTQSPNMFDVSIAPDMVVVGPSKEFTVSGDNPASFVPVSPATLPSNMASGTRFKFSCYIKARPMSRPGFVSLNFSGVDAQGRNTLWNSQWQPIGIPLESGEWKPTSFSDEIPDEILQSRDLKVAILFSPFQPDYLFLRKKEALKCSMLVRDAKLSLLAPLPLPALDKREWRLY